jgi:ABC-type multidrug transport system fused ATPase/permease subunit
VERLVPRLAELNNQRPRKDIAKARRRYYPTKGSRRHVLPISCAGNDLDAAREEDAGGGAADADVAAAAGSGGGATYSEKFRKLFPVSERLVLDLLEGRDVALQHNISLQEAGVVNARSSCAVMGRSGTGKTTCCLFRLLATARGAARHCARPLRQVCVCARS